VFRQFYCAEDESTLSISYQYVYCRGYLKPFEHYVSITVADRVENYTFYSGDSVPMNDSGVSGASSFYTESDSAMFDCIGYLDGSAESMFRANSRPLPNHTDFLLFGWKFWKSLKCILSLFSVHYR